jgi:elongation factor G
MNAIVWRDESLGAQWDVVEIPADLKDKAEEYRELLIETVVEADEAAMEPISKAKCRTMTRSARWSARAPSLCSSSRCSAALPSRTRAFSRFSTLWLSTCRARSKFLPSKGIDVKTEEETTRDASDDEPLSMLAFKVMNDPFVGSLTFCPHLFRQARKGLLAHEHGQGKARARRPHAADALELSREDIEEAFAGDIVALAGLKETTTGDTLCDPLKPVILERMEFPSR